MMSPRRLVLLAAVASLGLGFALTLPVEPYDSETMSLLNAAGAAVEARTAPDVELTGADGSRLRLSDLRGDVVYLNFWGVFCDTCKAELPSLKRFADEYGDRVRILTVAVDDDPSLPFQFLSQQYPGGVAFTVLNDPGSPLAGRFGTVAVPETYIINPEGEIMARLIGQVDFTSPEQQRLADHLIATAR
jgi:thiol-disulfide isomerase/thioredoxin